MYILTRLSELEKRLGVKREKVEDNFIEALLDSPGLDLSDEEKAYHIKKRDTLELLNAIAAVTDWSGL